MNVLVLAGGFDQIALIKELKKRGHTVFLADYYDNPPAKVYADEHFQVSTLDEQAILNLAKQKKVQLVTTACTDQALLTVARVSEELNLPFYLDSVTAERVTNKRAMKSKFEEYNIPTARSFSLKEGEDSSSIGTNKLRYPVIVKPCDCNSSKGVVKIDSGRDIQTAIQNAYMLSRSRMVIIEEYMLGKEISIDAWNDGDHIIILSISETRKLKANTNLFTIYQSRYPVALADSVLLKIERIAADICLAFNLRNCPLLIQAIVNGNQVNIIEFSARMGGGSKYKLIEYTSGVNVMRSYVDLILGVNGSQIIPQKSARSMELNYVYATMGIYKKIIGVQELIRTGEIDEVFEYKRPGAEITQRKTSGDRVFGFLISSETPMSLYEKRLRVIGKVEIIDSKDRSMMYKECFYEK